MNKLACLFVLLFVIQANADLKTFLNVITPNTTSPGCIRFSPYVNGLSPNGGPKPSADLIGQLLDILVAKTRFRCIMIDDMSGVYTTVIEAAHTRNIKVFGITYISADFVSNGDINEAIRLALLYPDTILGISCGTEIVWRNKDLDGTATAVNACLQKFRQANVTQPLGYCDTFSSWCNLSEWPCYNGYYSVYNNVDFFGVNEFSWYENFNSPQFTCVSAQGALDNTILRYNTILNLFGNAKPLLLSAYGWPGSKNESQNIYSFPNTKTKEVCGIANVQNQRAVNQRIINACATSNIPGALYMAFSEPWQAAGDDTSFINYWGICSGTPPYTCSAVPGPAGTTPPDFSPAVIPRQDVQPPVVPAPAPTPYNPLGLILGLVLGILGATTICAIFVIIVLVCCLRRQRSGKQYRTQTIIIKELGQSQPDYSKIENSVFACGMSLPDPTNVFLKTLTQVKNVRDSSMYLQLVDTLAMLSLIEKSTKRLTTKQVSKIVDGQSQLKLLGLPNSTSLFHMECATTLLDMLIAIDQHRMDIQTVIDCSNSSLTIQQCMKSIHPNWIFHCMLLRLIAIQAKTSTEHLHRFLLGCTHDDWHVLYDYTLLLTDLITQLSESTAIVISGEQAEDQSKVYAKLLGTSASCTSYSIDQNKWIRTLALFSIKQILSSSCSLAVKEEMAMILVIRKLLETDQEVSKIAENIISTIDLEQYKPFIESNWSTVITLFDDSWERKVVANQKVLEIHQEIEAWQVDIEKSQRKLANVVKAIQEGNKAESRSETILLEKITLCRREIARLERENISAQQVLHVAADEFESVKKQFDQLQKLYRVPQVNTATEYLGKTENRRSLDDMTTAVLENLATMSSYDDPNNS